MAKIIVQNTEITVSNINGEDYICITDMLKAKDGDFFVTDWLRNRNTMEFLGVWERIYNPNFNYGEFATIRNQAGLNSFKISVKEFVARTGAISLQAKAGRYGGTYAHKDIAFEFAMWISPEFKVYVVREFQRLKADEQKQIYLYDKKNDLMDKHREGIDQVTLPLNSGIPTFNYPQPKIIHSKVNNMKNFLSFSLLIVLTMFISSCSNVKSDGIYKTDNGWDIVEEGKTYSYSCEPDGLYLYLDWDGKNEYSLSFNYNSEIYRKTVGHTDHISFTSLKFLCKNKDGKYVYVAGWDEFDGCFYALKEIQFQVDAPSQPIYPYSRMKEYFSLMEKYTSN